MIQNVVTMGMTLIYHIKLIQNTVVFKMTYNNFRRPWYILPCFACNISSKKFKSVQFLLKRVIF